MVVAESVLQAKECIEGARDLPLDLELVLTEAVREATYRNAVVYDQIIESVRETASKQGLEEFARNLISKSKNHPRAPTKPNYGRDLLRNVAILDCAAHGVRDVFGASQLCHQVLSGQHAEEVSFSRGVKNLVKLCHQVLSGQHPWDVVWGRAQHLVKSAIRKI